MLSRIILKTLKIDAARSHLPYHFYLVFEDFLSELFLKDTGSFLYAKIKKTSKIFNWKDIILKLINIIVK